MLLPLIAVPVIILVAFAQSLVRAYAPSNILIRRVRASGPRHRLAVALGGVAFVCVLAVHVIDLAIEAGAADWLNLVVLIVAWDAIKFAVMACLTSARRVASAVGGLCPPRGWPVYR